MSHYMDTYFCDNSYYEDDRGVFRCKVDNGGCAFQRHCPIKGGCILTLGSQTCLNRNKKPKQSKDKTQKQSILGKIKRLFGWK